MKSDLDFLAGNGIMDYSLLLTIEYTKGGNNENYRWSTMAPKIEDTDDILRPILDEDMP
jgi:hypothetical protein